MDAALETQLIECLSALESGEPIEQILARYPEDATRLRPMLETAVALPALRMEPSQEVKSKSRKAFLVQAAALSGTVRPRRARFFSRPLATFAAMALAFVIVSGVVAASASALPGDPLYSVKRLVEDARLSLASDTPSRDALFAQFYQERIDEITALLAAGREAEVEFSAIIESIRPDAWAVAGLRVGVVGSTRIEGDPQVGRRAQVRGRTMGRMLIATSITVEDKKEPTPAPTPGLESTRTSQPQITPTPTTGSGPSPSNTPQPRPSPSNTSLPTPTSNSGPSPSNTPQPEEVRFEGILESINGNIWVVAGQEVIVTGSTRIDDNPQIGDLVEVRSLRHPDGSLIATRIRKR